MIFGVRNLLCPYEASPVLSEIQKDEAGRRLYRASVAGDLVAMATALAQGAEVNGSIPEEEGRTALIGAVVGVRRSQVKAPRLLHFCGNRGVSAPGLQGSLLACEFLLQNGANVNHRDLRGRGALHTAATAGHTG